MPTTRHPQGLLGDFCRDVIRGGIGQQIGLILDTDIRGRRQANDRSCQNNPINGDCAAVIAQETLNRKNS